MRQNPMLQPRVQAGGRSMPAWFSSTLVNQSRIGAPPPSPPPPPLPVEPPPEESDYEEIDHLPKNAMKKPNSRRSCSLCGNPNPAVSCEMCSNQIFCGSCNDMYHRHPKRQHHSRKILEPLEIRPPVPPKTPVPPEMMHAQLPPLPPSHPHSNHQLAGMQSTGAISTPQPPPRRKGRFGMRSAAGSPTTGIKSIFDPVGTLKRFMGGMASRPLPAPPKPPPPLPPKPADLGRSMTPTLRMAPLGDRRLSSPQPGAFVRDDPRGRIPVSVLEMQSARTHSISVANLSGHTSSRDSGYPDWEEDEEDFFARNRAHSVSSSALGRFPSTSQDASHFATMHRPGRNQIRQPPPPTSQQQRQNQDAPERPPPPLPPRQFPSQTQLAFPNSQSAFDLDRMAAASQQQMFGGMPPWNYPLPGYPMDFQQAMMMGYPGGTMHRTPSTQSMGPSMNPSSNPHQFGWGPVGFGPPMTQMEMEMMAAHHRRGSEQFMNMLPPQQQQHPFQQSQRGVPLSNPVTPQGSFRKKAGRHMSVEPDANRRLDRNLDLTNHRRSGTPSSFVRVPPSPSVFTSVPPQGPPSSSGKSKPPAKPPSDQSPDDSYFSAERQQTESTGSSESTPELTENPEGPWQCEHCTFINPKSTKVCTICCKTPAEGYRPMKGNKRAGGSISSAAKDKSSKFIKDTPDSGSGSRRRDSSSSSGVARGEPVPVVKSKLSISRDKQQAKVNLVSKVEKERVVKGSTGGPPSKSSMKAGNSGTLRAGTAPPGPTTAFASKKKGKSKQIQPARPVSQSDDDEEDDEVVADERQIDPENISDYENVGSDDHDGIGKGNVAAEDDDDEEEDDDEEIDPQADERNKSDDDADDEETGVVNVKIMGTPKYGSRGTSSSSSTITGAPKGRIISKKVSNTTPSSSASSSAGGATRKTTKAGKNLRAASSVTKKLVDSNEDVYGSVPIQTLAISPKIDIKRSSKSKVSTAAGPSPPPPKHESSALSISVFSANGSPPIDSKTLEEAIKQSDQPKREISKKAKSAKGSNDHGKESSNSSSSSPGPDQQSALVSTASPIPPITSSRSKRKGHVSSGIPAGNELEVGRKNSSTSGPSETHSSSPSHARKDRNDEGGTFNESDKGVEQGRKSSVGVGTSPPPQSISTQTYEDASISTGGGESETSAPNAKSSSKSSLRSEEYEAPRHIEMSEKAMRYARKARNKEQQYQKLKRSMSTQLTYPAESWMEPGEGRHLYRSSSRQSLASDTRSLPMSGPPSRESSPTPMGRYSRGGTGGRGGWYDDFRRYPLPSSLWDSPRHATMPPSDFFASIDDLMSRRRRETMRSQEFELTRMLKDAEECNFSPEDVQVAVRMCGDRNPIKWLQENWSSMIETVQTLATKYGREKGIENNDVGTVSTEEAKEAIRTNRGNVWAAVTECVDNRRKKFHELQSRGVFLREDILTALTAHHGSLEAAYIELSKQQLKPFLMRIWGPTEADNDSAAPGSSEQGAGTENAGAKESGESEIPGVSNSDFKECQSSLDSAPLGQVEQLDLSESLTSAAEKVTQETNQAIRELEKSVDIKEKESRSSSFATEKKSQSEVKDSSENELQQPPLPAVPDPKPASDDQNLVPPSLLKSDSEQFSVNAAGFHAKSDGEDESFVDAVSEAASTANSPPPPPLPQPNNQIESELVRDSLVHESNGSNEEDEHEIMLVEDEDELEEADEEDVLEIEIDDTEAHISDFIQNYEILPVNGASNKVASVDQKEPGTSNNEASTLVDQNIDDTVTVDESKEEDDSEDSNNKSGNETTTDKATPNVDFQQLLTTLSSTFSEMEQFAVKIKENIAAEVQQQLAAATAKVTKATAADLSEDGSYEPIALPPGIEENVNKKVAKYQRLRAKKTENVTRHKSPETRSEFPSGPVVKEPSVSPLPSTSSTRNKIIGDEARSDDEERSATGGRLSSDYEEVEISQEVENIEKVDEEDEEDADGVIVEYEEEEEEEDVIESSNVDESGEEAELMVEAEEEDQGNNNETGEVYGAVEISSGVSITPSDTDKVIIVGGSGMSAAAMAIRNNSTNVNNINSIIIMTEERNSDKTSTDIADENMIYETPAQKLIREGKAETTAQAELALQLLEMSFSEEDSLSAAKECSSLYSALSFLQQECDLCTGKFSAREMVSMLRCTHLCCRNCAREYFTVQVRDKTIVDATCPFCAEPSTLTDDAELATEYFNHLDILLKNLVDSKHHEMFQRKLRDWTLAKTPNFKWCSKCSSGFITEPLQTRLVCPDCKAVTCAVCLEPWDKVNHDHRDDLTGASIKLCDVVPKSIIEYLNANHIECPRCHFRFSLARGGCMHLTCTQCHYEFCSGCAAPFRMGEKCEAKFPICDKLGLHAHHPRNCLFYLRDKEPDVLSKLLEENAIPYFKENSGDPQQPTGTEEGNVKKEQRTCQVPIQKETSDGFADDICGKDAPEGYATVCKTHYIEYLGLLIWQNHLDPITILTNDDLEVIVRRAYKKHPGRPNWLSEEGFRKRLLKVINDEIPL